MFEIYCIYAIAISLSCPLWLYALARDRKAIWIGSILLVCGLYWAVFIPYYYHAYPHDIRAHSYRVEAAWSVGVSATFIAIFTPIIAAGLTLAIPALLVCAWTLILACYSIIWIVRHCRQITKTITNKRSVH